MKKIFIQSNSSIKEALRQLDKTSEGCLIVVNKKNKLLGTLSDGDLRRIILKGKLINDKISGIYEKKPTFIKKENYSLNHIKDLFFKKMIDVIPIVDNSNKVIDLVFFSELFKIFCAASH